MGGGGAGRRERQLLQKDPRGLSPGNRPTFQDFSCNPRYTRHVRAPLPTCEKASELSKANAHLPRWVPRRHSRPLSRNPLPVGLPRPEVSGAASKVGPLLPAPAGLRKRWLGWQQDQRLARSGSLSSAELACPSPTPSLVHPILCPQIL